MVVKLGAWHKLLSGFKCHVVRAHDWKRAVRVGGSLSDMGVKQCKRCSAKRTVKLRTAKPADTGPVPLEYPKTIFNESAGYALPSSQWPSSGGA